MLYLLLFIICTLGCVLCMCIALDAYDGEDVFFGLCLACVCGLGAYFSFQQYRSDKEPSRPAEEQVVSKEALTLAVGAQQKLFAAQGHYSANTTDLKVAEPGLGSHLSDDDIELDFELGADPRAVTVALSDFDGDYSVLLRAGRPLSYDCDDDADGCEDGHWRPDDKLRAALTLPEVLEAPTDAEPLPDPVAADSSTP